MAQQRNIKLFLHALKCPPKLMGEGQEGQADGSTRYRALCLWLENAKVCHKPHADI